jgi:hypoxanthine phosphoribosyltransferase
VSKTLKTVTINEKIFRIIIDSDKIQDAVIKIAQSINNDLKESQVIFVIVLNGAFMFAADLIKKINLNCGITFLKLASYDGMENTGHVKKLIGINEELENKTVVVIEDIVDTGNSLNNIIRQLNEYKPGTIKTATLLFKPGSYRFNYKPDYIGFEIPDNFVVGYGLDYNGYGRNLNHIYTVVES